MKCEVGREWTWTKVGRICKTNVSSYSPSERWPFVNYLETKGIMGGRISEIQHIILAKQRLPSRARRKVSKNDIIYSTVRPNQRHYGIIKEPLPNMLVSTGFSVLTVDATQCDAAFLYYWLSQNRIVETLQVLAEQSVSTYPTIRDAVLEALEILLPPLSVQKRIAAILSALDDKIELNNKISANLEQQAQALYKHYFPYSVDCELPAGWRIGSVGEIIEIHDSKRIPLSGAERAKMEKKTYPYYGAAALMDYVDDYIFDGKYLLLGEDGTVVDESGYPILQYVWGKFWANNHAHILTGKLGFNVENLYMLFKQTPVKAIVTGAVQSKISQTNLRSIQVVIPPEKLLMKYNYRVEPLFTLLRSNTEENNSLSILRDSLLPRLMSGEIRISDVQLLKP